MDGIKATTEKICNISSSIKVIMLTVFEEPDKIFRAIKAGAAGYVLKNTKPAQLVEQLKTLNRGGASDKPGGGGKAFYRDTKGKKQGRAVLIITLTGKRDQKMITTSQRGSLMYLRQLQKGLTTAKLPNSLIYQAQQ